MQVGFAMEHGRRTPKPQNLMILRLRLTDCLLDASFISGGGGMRVG